MSMNEKMDKGTNLSAQVDPGTMVTIEMSAKEGRTIINASVIRIMGGVLRVKANIPLKFYDLQKDQIVKAWFPRLRRIAPLKHCKAQVYEDGSDQIDIFLPSEDLPRNRRISMREDMELPVAVSRQAGAWRAKGYTVNISGSGAMVELPDRLDVNEKVRLSVRMPDEEGGVIAGNAEVVWSSHETNRHFYGLKFAQLHDTFVKRLCRITLRKRKERNSRPPPPPADS